MSFPHNPNNGNDDELELLKKRVLTNRMTFVLQHAPRGTTTEKKQSRAQLEELERIFEDLNNRFHIAGNPKLSSMITAFGILIEKNPELVPYMSIVLKSEPIDSLADLENALKEITATLKSYNDKMHTSERNGSEKLKEMIAMRAVIIDLLESDKPVLVEKIETQTRHRIVINAQAGAPMLQPISTPPESVARAKIALRNYLPQLDELIVHLSENPTNTILSKLGYDLQRHEIAKKLIEKLKK